MTGEIYRIVRLAIGDSRSAATYDSGWIDCPWCSTGWPPDREHCPNPACLASEYATEESVRETLDRRETERAAEESRRRVRQLDTNAALRSAARDTETLRELRERADFHSGQVRG